MLKSFYVSKNVTKKKEVYVCVSAQPVVLKHPAVWSGAPVAWWLQHVVTYFKNANFNQLVTEIQRLFGAL